MRSSAFSFLFLYVCLSELYLGSLAILCFRALVPSAWLEPLVPAMLRVARAGWILALLFPLLVLAAPWLYGWAAAPVAGNAFRTHYLSLPAFALRGAIYWVSWLWLARAARRREPWTGGAGMAWLLVTGTLASVDWMLSLEDGFGSTLFGLVFLMSCLLLAFGFAVVAGSARSGARARQDQGSVHLAVLCTWTYVSFMQFLVVWSGNLPQEAAWYQRRGALGWGLLPAGAALGQFLLPFLLLVQSPVKRSVGPSRALAFLSVAFQVVLVFWQILPALRPHLSLSVSDALAFLVFALVLARLGKEPLAALP